MKTITIIITIFMCSCGGDYRHEMDIAITRDFGAKDTLHVVMYASHRVNLENDLNGCFKLMGHISGEQQIGCHILTASIINYEKTKQ
jgi:hypothetical protein